MYWLEQQPASIPSIHSTLREDLYVILTAVEPDGSATLKVYRNPLVNWIWIGGDTFVLGTLADPVAASGTRPARPRADDARGCGPGARLRGRLALARSPRQRAARGAAGATPDVPGGPGDDPRPGRARRATRRRRPDVEVVLYALPAGRARRACARPRPTRTARFAFEGISNDPEHRLPGRRARRRRPLPRRARRASPPARRERAVEVRIAEPTTDPRRRRRRASASCALDWRRRPPARAPRRIALRERRPARGLRAGRERARGARPAFRDRAAGRRGGLRGSARHRCPRASCSDGGELRLLRSALSRRAGARRFALRRCRPRRGRRRALAQAAARRRGRRRRAGARRRRRPPALGASPRTARPTVDGRGYARFAGERVRPGARARARRSRCRPLRSDPDAVSRRGGRASPVELDDAALLVREEHAAARRGRRAPSSRRPARRCSASRCPRAPRTCASRRTPSGSGCAPDPDGGLAVLGPIPPGESDVELAYRVPIADRAPVPLRRSLRTRGAAALGLRRRHRPRVAAPSACTGGARCARRTAPTSTSRPSSSSPARRSRSRSRRCRRRGGAAAARRSIALVALVAAAPSCSGGPLRRCAPAPDALDEPRAARGAQRARVALRRACATSRTTSRPGKLADADYAHDARGAARARRGAAGGRARRAARAAARRRRPDAGRAGLRRCGAAARAGDRFCARCGARARRRSRPRGLCLNERRRRRP